MAKEQANQSYTNSVERAIDILEYLATHGSGVSVMELSNEFGVNRTSIYSILKALSGKGYIRKVSDGKYALTGRMFEYGQKFKNSFPIVHMVRSIHSLKKFTYPAQLNIAMHFDGVNCILMSSIDIKPDDQFIVDRAMHSGQSIPLHATSLGKLLLAYMPPAESSRLLEEISYDAYTEHTVKNAEALWEQMHQAVINGYAYECNEFYNGSFCVAAPVFDQTNTVIAACSISCNSLYTDVSKDIVVRDVRLIAKSLSTALGSTVHYR